MTHIIRNSLSGLAAFLLFAWALFVFIAAISWRLLQLRRRFFIALPMGMIACLAVWLVGGYASAVAWSCVLAIVLIAEPYLHDDAPRRRRRRSPIAVLGQGDYTRAL